jgi:hypothetical protein
VGALLGATHARYDGVTDGTTARGAMWWKRWIEFLHHCELDDDVYLRQFSPHKRHLLLGAFAHKARTGEWFVSSKGYDHLVAGTCRTAIDSLCQAFVTAGWDDPGKDSNGELAFILRWQIRRYKNEDPSEQPQKAIPFGLLQKIISMQTKNQMRRRFQLLTHMAFFFAMLRVPEHIGDASNKSITHV